MIYTDIQEFRGKKNFIVLNNKVYKKDQRGKVRPFISCRYFWETSYGRKTIKFMNTEDLISVIIPVYNSEKYVRETLDSILKQTYKNLEILVIDDGSTDSSPAICDEYLSDDRVKVFHRQNAGVAASRQFGFDNSHGIYYVTLDSDDYVSEDFVEKLYSAIKKNDADISVCGVSCFTDGNPEITAVFMPSISDEKLAVTKEILDTDFYKISRDFLLTDSWNKMFRAAFIRDTGVRYQLNNIYCGSELMYNHRLALHCPVYCVCRESLLFHRNHPGSLMTNKDKPLQEGFEIITESLIEESKKCGLSLKEPLSDVYYGLIGMVLMDIHHYGGNVKEKHRRLKKFVAKNKSFLREKNGEIVKYPGMKKVPIPETSHSFPAFLLGNALWLDFALMCYCFMREIKNLLKR